MFKSVNDDGSKNICGKNVARFRKEINISQNELAHKLQLEGIEVEKNSVQRLEAGQRFVTDIEVIAFAKVFNKSIEEILGINEE